MCPSNFTLPSSPIHLEYCSGNGRWIAAKAGEHRQINWVAVDRRSDRCRKILSKQKNGQLTNLFVFCTEALSMTKNHLPNESVEEVYINFPDPWPKRRHTKHRLMTAMFFDEVARILKKGGTVSVVTDDVNTCLGAIALLKASPHFAPVYPAPHFVHEREGYGTSTFEELWRLKGKPIHYVLFKK